MDRSGEQFKFETQPTIEQRPFENQAVESFFARWCEINDSIQPKVVTREQWNNQRLQGVLKKETNGKQTLFIPRDLQLWEMVGIIEVVDKDTFATKPEQAVETKTKIQALGKTFENTAIYIAKRIDKIGNGREIAEALALEFYQYGRSITQQGETPKITQVDEIKSLDLTPQETEAVDHFLAGDALYDSRRRRVERLAAENQTRSNDLYEEERQKALTQFFNTAQKAFELENKAAKLQKNPTKPQPWQNASPIHRAFLKRVNRALTKQIETPKREFASTIFRRGMELLQHNMPFDTLPNWVKNDYLSWQNGETTLRDALKIDELKAELDKLRQNNNTEQISSKEVEIANKIQKVISNFPRKLNANNPAEMVANQNINCVGASMLGGALMKEVGLNYLLGDVPEHSILFLITSDGRVQWLDMLNTSSNGDLTNEMIKGQREDGKPLTINDIVAFSQKPDPKGLMFDIDDPSYRKKFRWVKEGQRQYVTIFDPEYGQQVQILNTAGSILNDLGRDEEAIAAYQQAISIDPKYAYAYNGLGNSLRSLNRDEEAIVAYQQAISIDPKHAYAYYNMGNSLGRLNRHEEAIGAYQKFIDLADKENQAHWIKRAKGIVANLREQLSAITPQR